MSAPGRPTRELLPASIDRGRRATLLACATALLAPFAARAQDPRAAEAQRAAREWLTAADQLDGRTTWTTAGRRLKQSATLRQWSAALQRQRGQHGAVEQRTLVATSFPTSLPPAGTEGEFAVVVFRTAFAKRALAGERVTLEREADGAWRVARYVIR